MRTSTGHVQHAKSYTKVGVPFFVASMRAAGVSVVVADIRCAAWCMHGAPSDSTAPNHGHCVRTTHCMQELHAMMHTTTHPTARTQQMPPRNVMNASPPEMEKQMIMFVVQSPMGSKKVK